MKALEYKIFLNEGRNYQSLSYEEAKDFCLKNCLEWVKSLYSPFPRELWKGGKTFSGIVYTDPSKEGKERFSKYGESTDLIISMLREYDNSKIQDRKKSLFYTSSSTVAQDHSPSIWNPEKPSLVVIPDNKLISYIPFDFNIHPKISSIRGNLIYLFEILEEYGEYKDALAFQSGKITLKEWFERNSESEIPQEIREIILNKYQKEITKDFQEFVDGVCLFTTKELYSQKQEEKSDEFWSESPVLLIPWEIEADFKTIFDEE